MGGLIGDDNVESYSTIPNNTHAKWWKDPCLRKNVAQCAVCGLCVVALGYDQSLLTGLQAIPQWGDTFGHPSGTMLGVITSSLFFPSLVFTFVAGWMADKWGRKSSVTTGCILIIIGAFFAAFCNTRNQFIGARVVIGAGCAFCKVSAPVLLNEIAHPRLRPMLAAVYFPFNQIGNIGAGWLTFGGVFVGSNWGWRYPLLLQAIGPILVICCLYFVPESPRWLISQGKHDLALANLSKYHANGAADDPLVQYEYEEIQAILEQDKVAKKSSYLDLFKTPGNRRRLLALVTLHLGANWIGNGLVSYYVKPILNSVGIKNPVKITGINGGLAVWNAFTSFLGGYYAARLGRRPLLLMSQAGMFVAYALIMGLSAGFATTGKTSMGIAVIPMLYFYELWHHLGWTPMPYAYIAEIMPYGLRAKGLALAVTVNQLGNGFNQFVNPIALKAIAWKYYSLYLVTIAVIEVIFYFYFPETKGLSLEEITYVFDHGVKGARSGAAAEARAAVEAMRHERKAEEAPAEEGDEKVNDPKQQVKHINEI